MANANTDLAYEYIRKKILVGEYPLGSALRTNRLAVEIGVSRTPIRAALHRLKQEGYIQVASGSGSKARLSVAPLTQDDARELYQIVGHLEGLAARSTAQLEPKLKAAVVQKLKELNDGLRELADSRRADPNRIFDLDMNFHQTIVEASAGPRLSVLLRAVKPQAERYWRLYTTAILDQLGISIGEHLLIIQGIENGDGAGAERAVLLNWENGADRLARVIESLGERGSW